MKSINFFTSILFVLLLSGPFGVMLAQRKLLDSLALDTLKAFTSMDLALNEPGNVVKLVLRKKKLKEIPVEIYQFKNLQYLDLGKNNIKVLPPAIGDLQSLQVLILSKNKIEVLPKEISALKNLRVLNVNQNELTSIPPQIGDLDNLEFLDLWSNNINEFPEQLVNLDKLKVMDLRVIIIDDEVQHHLQSLLPQTKIHFSPGCKCKTQ